MRHFWRKLLNESGFTLIELMVAISIVGMLSSVSLVSLNSARNTARIGAGMAFDSQTYRANGTEAVLMYDFEEDSGDIIYNTAMQTQGQYNSTTTSQTRVEGKVGKALLFPGGFSAPGYIQVTYPDLRTNADIFGGVSSGKIFASMWFRATTGGIGYLIMNLPGIYQVNIEPSNKIRYAFTTSPNTSSGWITQTAIKPGEWTHLAILLEAGVGYKIWINGQLDRESQATYYTLDTVSLVPTTFGHRFAGEIDQIRVYKYPNQQ